MWRNCILDVDELRWKVERIRSLMNDVIKLSVNTSTDSHHVAVADLLCEIIMVIDNFLTLPGWFTRDDIIDIIFSICVS